jgi:hypothetical protein
VVEDTVERTGTRRESTGTVQELYLSLLWLGIAMYSAHVTLRGGHGAGGVLDAAKAAMPDLILAGLVAGASLGAAAGTRVRGAARRLPAGLAMGAGFGLVAALAMRAVYGAEPHLSTLAITAGLSGLVGGALAVLPTQVVEGGLWSMTWVAFLGVMFPVWLLGLGTDSFLADTRVQAALMGVVGLYALQRLRGAGLAWLWYPVAGGLAGVLLLAAELLTRLGSRIRPGTASLLAPSAQQLRIALIVIAVGGGVGLLAGLRSLLRRPGPEDPDADAEAEAGQ